jgi:Putative metal-binding motif
VGGDAINAINGGADNDTILVSAAHNQNNIDGGTGNDTIEYPVGPDLINGGDGIDTVLYSTDAGTTVNVSLDNQQNDGKAGTFLGNVHTDVENLTGGEEDDTFTGSGASNVLITGNGNDTINAQDGVHDTVDCGSGDDTASVDAVDTVTGCEHVTLPDADHDGYTEDVDCNDHSGSIHPGAVDTPGDGIDQDCSGGDAPLPIVDIDHDGSVPPADCNDHNAAIHPGATDIPENRVDENCDGHDAAYPTLDAPITNRWLFGTTTRVILLEVKGVPAGATVKVRCKTKAKGCPFRSKRVAVKRGKAKLTSLFKHRKLKPGARIDVSITAPAAIGKLVRFTMRRNKIPKAQALCIRPGAKPAARC